jgi:cell wall-associated NlpC family hydrolase
MKGRSRAIFIALIALLVAPIAGYSRNANKSSAIQKEDSHKTSGSGSARYSVRSGDNLIRIAKHFRTTPESIKSANNLKDSKIKAGQILIIPGSKSALVKTGRPLAAQNSSDPNQAYISAATPSSADVAKDADSENAPTRLRLVQAGFQMIGIRYRFGGSAQSGIDCSGLVKSLFSKFNIELPRSSREQFKQGEKVNKDDLEPGDLVFFSSGGSQPTHVGIYVGNNQMLHAARTAKQVIVSDISKVWDRMRYLGARRVMDLWSDDPTPEEKK